MGKIQVFDGCSYTLSDIEDENIDELRSVAADADAVVFDSGALSRSAKEFLRVAVSLPAIVIAIALFNIVGTLPARLVMRTPVTVFDRLEADIAGDRPTYDTRHETVERLERHPGWIIANWVIVLAVGVLSPTSLGVLVATTAVWYVTERLLTGWVWVGAGIIAATLVIATVVLGYLSLLVVGLFGLVFLTYMLVPEQIQRPMMPSLSELEEDHETVCFVTGQRVDQDWTDAVEDAGWTVASIETHDAASDQPQQAGEETIDPPTVDPERLEQTEGKLLTLLHDRPLSAYLEDDQQPCYLFQNTTKGLSIDGPDGNEERSGDSDHFLLLTDEGLHFVAGDSGGDIHAWFPYDDLESAEKPGGEFPSFLAFDDGNGTRYEFGVRDQDDETVREAVAYAQQRIDAVGDGGQSSSDPDEVEAPISTDDEGEANTSTEDEHTESSEPAIDERTESARFERSIQPPGVDSERLDRRRGRLYIHLFHRPLDYYLDDETPAFLLKNVHAGLAITDPSGEKRRPDHAFGAGYRFLLVTDRGIHYVAGKKAGDEYRFFPYDELTGVDSTESLSSDKLSFEDEVGYQYAFASDDYESGQLDRAASYIQERIDAARAGTDADPSSSRPVGERYHRTVVDPHPVTSAFAPNTVWRYAIAVLAAASLVPFIALADVLSGSTTMGATATWITVGGFVLANLAVAAGLYLDARMVRETGDWPTYWRLYVMAGLVPLLNIIVATVYLVQRPPSASCPLFGISGDHSDTGSTRASNIGIDD